MKSKYIKENMLKGNGRNLKRSDGARSPRTAFLPTPQPQGIKDTRGKMKELCWLLITHGIIFFPKNFEKEQRVSSQVKINNRRKKKN